jgi:SAM-dependent methyltransferase
MKLENITLEEMKSFINSLTVEKKYFKQPFDIVLNAEFITGVRSASNLAGVGGITISYRIFPFCFCIVKSEFQGKGIAHEISQQIISVARNRYDFLALTVNKKNAPALKLYHREGFRIAYEQEHSYWMFLPLNKRGEIIGRFLLPLIIRIYLSPLRNFLRFIRRLFDQHRGEFSAGEKISLNTSKNISHYESQIEAKGSVYRTCYWDEQRRLKVLRLLDVFDLPSNRYVLDFGSGTGTYTPYLKSHYDHVVGLDATMTNLKIAMSIDENDCEYLCGDGNWLPFKDKSISIVFCAAVLYQFVDLAEPLREINRVLIDDGFLFISEPNIWNPVSFIQYYNRSTEEWKRGDPRPLSWLELKHKLIQTGFKCLKVRGVNFTPCEVRGAWSVVRRMEPYIESLPLFDLLGGTLLVTAKKATD